MKSLSFLGRIYLIVLALGMPYMISASPVISSGFVPAMYWKSYNGTSIYYTGGSVGIGFGTPSFTLDVNGTGSFVGFRLPTGASNNYILTSDASGNARWTALSFTETDPQVGVNAVNYLPKWDGSALITGTITDSGTNIGIGTATPGAKLGVNGAIKYASGLIRTEGTVTKYNNVMSWGINSPSQTGSLKITLPKGWSSTMLRIEIEGYDYGSNAEWSVVISGYNYLATTTWINHSAEIHGSAPFTQVRLAYDGTKNVILLGNTGTVWQYPQMNVKEVAATYSNQSGWETGWTAGLITDESAITNSVSPTIPFFLNSGGNLGIGNTNPQYKLDVTGTGQFTGFRLPTGASNSYILTSDASGNARWAAPATSGWGLTGNAGTTASTNFIGTTDNQPLVVKVNSIELLKFTTGSNIAGLGYSSYFTGATNSLVIGTGAGQRMFGSYNIVLGVGAGSFMTGSYNTAFGGNFAGWYTNGLYNTAIGGNGAGSSMGGSNNTAIGGDSAGSNMNGSYNTAIGGSQAGISMYGNQNSVFGGALLGNNMNGTLNTAVGGSQAGYYMSGSRNTALGGAIAGWYMSGSHNAALGGFAAGTAMNGSYNTALGGYYAGWNMVGTGNLALGGYNATITNSNVQYSVVIGSGAISTQSGAIILGGSGSNVGIGLSNPSEKLHVNGNVLATEFLYTSDRRLKTDINRIENALDKLNVLSGYSYIFKSTGKRDIGVIAQEVELVFPDLVHTDQITGMKSVEYANLVAPIIEAIKEISNKINLYHLDNQKNQIDILELKKQNQLIIDENVDLREENRIIKEQLLDIEKKLNNLR